MAIDLKWCDLLHPGQERSRLRKARHRIDGDPFDKCRLCRVRLRDDQTIEVCIAGGDCDRKDPMHAAHLAVERKFTHDQVTGRGECQLLRSDDDRERGRQIKPHPFLAQVGRGKVGGDPLRRKGVARVLDRAPDPFSALSDLLFREADDLKGWEPPGHIALNFYHLRVDPDHHRAQ